jgi:hypothetical protein
MNVGCPFSKGIPLLTGIHTILTCVRGKVVGAVMNKGDNKGRTSRLGAHANTALDEVAQPGNQLRKHRLINVLYTLTTNTHTQTIILHTKRQVQCDENNFYLYLRQTRLRIAHTNNAHKQ